MAILQVPSPQGIAALSQYKNIVTAGSRFDALGANTQILLVSDTNALAAAAGSGKAAFYLDPADYPTAGTTNYLRVVESILTNDVAPTVNFTAGLYPVSATAGAAANVNVTLGTVTTGSTALISAPAADTRITAVASSDFAFPAAGYYVLACVISGAMAASSSIAVRVTLQRREV